MSKLQYSFGDYLHAFRRRSPLFIWVAAPILIISTAFALGLPDVYRSSAEFRVDLEGPNVDLLEPVVLTNYADQYVQSLEQSALSRGNLEKWLDRFNVYPDATTSSRGDLISEMRHDVRLIMVTTGVVQPGSGKEVDLITGFSVGFDSKDPVIAQQVAEAIAQEFLNEDRETRRAKAATTSSFLSEQIADRRREISELESQLADFKEENADSLPEMMTLNMSIIDRTERELENVQAEIGSLEENRIFRQAQLEEIRRKSPAAGQLAELEQEYLRMISSYASDHPDLIRIRRQIAALTSEDASAGKNQSAEIAQLEADLASLRERYSNEHPDVVSLSRRIQTLRLQTRETMASVRGGPGEDPLYLQLRAQINAIDSKLASLRNRAHDLRSKLAQTEQQIAKTPQVEREYQGLLRDLDTAKDTYRDLQERLAVAQQTEALESGERGARLTMIERPYVPDSPASPPRLAIIVLGVFLSLSLGTFAAILAEGADSTVRGSRDIIATLDTQPIVTVPIVQNSLSRAHRRRQVFLYGGAFLIAVAILASAAGAPGIF